MKRQETITAAEYRLRGKAVRVRGAMTAPAPPPFRASGDVPAFVVVEVPVRIVSTPNAREHWSVTHRRAVQHDEAVTYSLIGRRDLAALVELGPPYVVTLTVKGPRLLDSDNCIAGLKSVRDSIARLLGVNDGDREAVQFVYAPQEIAPYGIRIAIVRQFPPTPRAEEEGC